MPKKACNLKGQKFGILTVSDRAGSDKWRNATWFVECDCGSNKKIVSAISLTCGDRKHCGCLTSQHRSDVQSGSLHSNYIDGRSKTREYDNELAHNRRVFLKTPSDDRPIYSGSYKTAKDKHDFCVYCGVSYNLTIDHILPVSKGGTNDPKNLVRACADCNGSKHDKLFIDWYNRHKGYINTLEEILDYMGFESLEHLTNYQDILVHVYHQKNLF